MIRVRRTSCPATLRGKTSDGTHYNKAEVVAALWAMQHGKCCYCERKLPETGHLKAVEHFKPKSVFTGLRNEWTNLLLACSQCNGKKRDKFPVVLSDEVNEDKVLYLDTEQPAILDPSDPEIDPEDHIDFDFDPHLHEDGFAVIMAKNGSDLGAKTIETIGLHGLFYLRERRDRFRALIQRNYLILVDALEGGDEDEVSTARWEFELLLKSRKPFAGFARAYARFKGLDKPPLSVRIPKG